MRQVEKEKEREANGKTRWSVTYTKHIKQKRKKYQDGFLLLQPSTNKLSLFDECEKLLECKVLNPEELARLGPGDTVPFNSYLVDVGEPEAAENRSRGDQKWSERPNVIRRQKFRSPTVTCSASNSRNELLETLSPSRRIIRDFRKSVMQRYGAPLQGKGNVDAIEPSASEWQVLYTTQVTQKAKKYHDGFLRVAGQGTLGRQVNLYDECRELLTSRFLKKEEMIKCGELIKFDGYLVDIGEHIGDCKTLGQKLQDHQSSLGEKKTTNGQQGCHCTTLAKEWEVLYTNQVTQKAKRYHNGFLKLVTSGSLGRQIMLHDASRSLLESRFLKKDETVATGASIRLNAHLVDIGEAKQENQLPSNFDAQENHKILGGKARATNEIYLKAKSSVANGDLGRQDSLTHIAETGSISSSDNINRSKYSSDRKPLRDASQILSILQKPVQQENAIAGCHDKEIIASPSSTKGPQDSGCAVDCTEDAEVYKSSMPDRESGHVIPAQITKTTGIDKLENFEFSKGKTVFDGFCLLDSMKEGKLDQCPGEDDVGVQQNEHFSAHNPDLAGTCALSVVNVDEDCKVARLCSREVDECPTFDLGF